MECRLTANWCYNYGRLLPGMCEGIVPKCKIKVDRAVMSCYIACTLTLNTLVNAYF